MGSVRVATVGIVVGALALLGAACVPVPPPVGTPSGGGCGKPATVGNLQPKKLLSAGKVRSYYLSVPPGYDARRKTPVILNFHGAGSNAAQQAAYTQMDPRAGARGFVVVTPDGIDNVWDFQSPSDDFTFTADLVRYLDSTLCIDRARVFATGISNGGAFSSAVVCEPSVGIRAFVSVAGMVPACANGTKAPAIAFHGTADPIVPYSVAGPIAASWGARDGCDATPVETRIEPDVQKRTFVHCGRGLSVTLYSIEGGGHTWPDGLVDLPQFGPTTRTIDATDLAIDFFCRQL